ncbi:MAG: hypothetical protein HY895_00585, partial [Deltaproteobacteria bacterium]|nr:hypothetical protein [Deltaproteobacteria bacterium]
MKAKIFAILLIGQCFLVSSIHASLITFDDQGLTGSSVFGGAAQPINITVDTITATFTGGVILKNTTNLPADQTALYGTASFGNATYQTPLTVTFSQSITNFFLDVYNGNVEPIQYTVADNSGHSFSTILPTHLNGGTTQVAFPSVGTKVTIQSALGASFPWDFFIDNITFTKPLPEN